MAAWNCGWCGKFAHMKPVDNGWQVPTRHDEELRVTLSYMSRIFTYMECPSCNGRSIAHKLSRGAADHPVRLTDVDEFWRDNDPDRVAPQWIEGQDFDYAPQHIAKAASESYKCHSISAYMSAILMARSSIEAAAKDHEVKTGNLKAKIDALADRGLIRKAIKDAAHQVRMFGNDMAHGDIKVEVTEVDSLQVLQLLTFILQDLYEVDDVMSKVGLSLDARKAEGEA